MTLSTLKSNARTKLIGHYGKIIYALLSFAMLSYVLSSLVPTMPVAGGNLLDFAITFVSSFIVLLLTELFSFGLNAIFLDLARTGQTQIFTLFSGLRKQPDKIITGSALLLLLDYAASAPVLAVYYLVFVFRMIQIPVLQAWIFLGVSGLISAILLAYVHLTYGLFLKVCQDNPRLSAMQMLGKSKQLMKGQRVHLLLFYLSMLGYLFLGILSLGLGFLWIVPYIKMCVTEFYLTIINEI